MITLTVDTSDNRNVFAILTVDGKEFKAISENKEKRPESILLLIDKVCRKATIKVSDIEKIEVNEGPGSYTGLKVGASVANALSFALGKKVNDKNLGDIVEPRYD